MKRMLLSLLICTIVSTASAQEATPTPAAASAANPLTNHNRTLYAGIKTILLRAAEKMPEEHYAFRPTEEVRTFGQIVGHIADSQYTFCSTVLGEKNPALRIEKNKTSRSELVAALKESFAYCDTAYNRLTDASATEMVRVMGSDAPKLGALSVNNVHSIEHYGNLVTYLRIKNIVPPTSEPAFLEQMMKKK